jgi:hypothetical protein
MLVPDHHEDHLRKSAGEQAWQALVSSDSTFLHRMTAKTIDVFMVAPKI